MLDTNNIINEIADRAPEHYNVERHADGILYCTVCGKPLEMVINVPKLGGTKRLPIICDCDKKRRETREEQKRQEEISHNRNVCFQNSGKSRLKEATFASDLGYNAEEIEKAKKYVSKSDQVMKGGDELRKGMGLLLYGPLGTGKSFIAAAIMNAMLDKGYRCLWTTFSEIETRIRTDYDAKPILMEELMAADLLIIDDLGAERRSEYMTQLSFDVVDMRYRASKPMIVTTNLTKQELLQTDDVDRARIYDRILDCCIPIEIKGKSIRRREFGKHYEKEMKALS